MAASAVSPTSLVEISISCRNLRDTDVFSKSDPMCIVYYQPFGSHQYSELKRTECIDNTLNPEFATKIPITFHFEEQQKLKFCLIDIDSDNPNVSDQDFLGEYECTVAQLVGSGIVEKPLVDRSSSSTSGNGTIILTTEELSSCKEELCIQFTGKKLENNHWFHSISTFLEFYKSNESGKYSIVFRTDTAKSTEDPVYKEFSVPLRTFSSGDDDRNIKVVCREFISSGDHKEIGTFYTTVRKLKAGPSHDNTYNLMNEHKQKKKGSSYKGSGTIIVNRVHIKQSYSFVDFLKGGTELNGFIAIDFTASNGNPTAQTSLHYIDANKPNQYCSAIQAVGTIIEDYDTDKFFPVLGFGARMPPDYTTVSHEFYVNGNPTNPFCHRVQGVLEAYYASLGRVQLYGPTNFAPIINHVARFAHSNRQGDKYFILLILTDGIITDMPMTKEAIVNASQLPLSIIIVGVGNAEFDAMEELDGDTVRLSSNGKYAARDIVQFVPYRDFLRGGLDQHTARLKLAREVLAEIPEQFVSYMKVNNISPQPPKANNIHIPDPSLNNMG